MPWRSVLAAAVLLATSGVSVGVAAENEYFVDRAATTPYPCSDTHPERGSTDRPYCTIQTAVAEKGSEGHVTITVRGGSSAAYKEMITVGHSGVSDTQRLVIRSEGTPAPLIEGYERWSYDGQGNNKWTKAFGSGNNVWKSTTNWVTWTPTQVLLEGGRLTHNPTITDLEQLPSGQWKFVPEDALYVNVGGDPALEDVWLSPRANAFLILGRSYVTIEGFDIEGTNDKAIRVDKRVDQHGTTITSSYIILKKLNILFAGAHGIHLVSTDFAKIQSNYVNGSLKHGVMLQTSDVGGVPHGSDDATVEDNVSLGNFQFWDPTLNNGAGGWSPAAGFHVSGSHRAIFRRNRACCNYDSGFNVYSSHDAEFQNNISHLNTQHGFDHNASLRAKHSNGVSYGNGTGTANGNGFNFEANGAAETPNFELHNSIATGHSGTNHYNLRVYTNSQTGWQSDFNIYWISGTDPRILWGNTLYSSLSTFTGTGNDDFSSIAGDPLFVSPSLAKFSVDADSPAVDQADSGAASYPATDFAGQSRFDDPVASNGGAGTPDYADLGAFEFVNIVTNPSFEVDFTGWANYTTGTTSARVEGGKVGSYAWEVTGPADTSSFGINDSSDWV